MLILTRKLDDSFLLEWKGGAEPIEIKVVELTNGQVRLGVTAPKDCKIWRKELYQTVVHNRQAAGEENTSIVNLRRLVSKLGDGEDKLLK